MQEIADFCNDVVGVEEEPSVKGDTLLLAPFFSEALWAIGEYADGENPNALEEFRAAHPIMQLSS